MKRITVSLPDELVDRLKQAAGRQGVSAYVARALDEALPPHTLAALVAEWTAETPIPEDVERHVDAEFNRIFHPQSGLHERQAG